MIITETLSIKDHLQQLNIFHVQASFLYGNHGDQDGDPAHIASTHAHNSHAILMPIMHLTMI